MKKKSFRINVSDNLFWNIDGLSPDELQTVIEDYVNDNPELYNWKIDCDHQYDDYSTLFLTAERDETDAEFKRRKERAAKAKIACDKRKATLKAKKELEELELLEKLKAKYEKSNYKKPK